MTRPPKLLLTYLAVAATLAILLLALFYQTGPH